MQWTDITKDWASLSKKFQVKWNKLTDADLKIIAGRRDELVQRLGKYYKLEKDKIGREVDDFIKTIKPVKI